MSARNWCCFIDEAGVGCPKVARWEGYWYAEGGFAGRDTHACYEHLVHLIPRDREVNVTALDINVVDMLAELA